MDGTFSKEEEDYLEFIPGVDVPLSDRCVRELGHVTVVGILKTSFGIPLVLPSQSGGGNCWIPPQGKVEEGETPLRALLREVHEELGIPPSCISCSDARLLGFFPSPHARGGQKLLVGVGVDVESVPRIRVNGENLAACLVRNKAALEEKMRRASSAKQGAVALFLRRAGLADLPGWGMPPARGLSPFS